MHWQKWERNTLPAQARVNMDTNQIEIYRHVGDYAPVLKIPLIDVKIEINGRDEDLSDIIFEWQINVEQTQLSSV